MVRDVFEKGLSSIVARYLLDGAAEALLARVGQAGVLTAGQLEQLRRDTIANLEKARDDGAPYAALVTQALQEAGKAVPLGSLAGPVASLAGAVPWRELATSATRTALDVAARSAQRAAERAQAAASAWNSAQPQGSSGDSGGQTPPSGGTP